jgi:hypothetical protein
MVKPFMYDQEISFIVKFKTDHSWNRLWLTFHRIKGYIYIKKF